MTELSLWWIGYRLKKSRRLNVFGELVGRTRQALLYNRQARAMTISTSHCTILAVQLKGQASTRGPLTMQRMKIRIKTMLAVVK